MRRRIVIATYCLALGFVAQFVAAMLWWHYLWDGTGGWTVVRLSEAQSTEYATESMRVLQPNGSWVEEPEWVSHRQASWRWFDIHVVKSFDDAQAKERIEEAIRINSAATGCRFWGEWARVRTGAPFRSVGSEYWDEVVQGVPGAMSLDHRGMITGIRESQRNEEGVKLSHALLKPIAPYALRESSSAPFVRNTPLPPTRFYVLGSLGNTVLWSLPFFLLLWIWGRLMKWNRRRRGLCTKCKYQLAGLETCPECGAPRRRHISTTPKPPEPPTVERV